MRGYFIENLLTSFGLDVDGLRVFLPQAKVRSFESGETLMARGNSDVALLFVATGLVLATVNTNRDKNSNTPVMAVAEGMWVGAKCVMAGKPADFSYVAASEVSVIEFSSHMVRSMMAASAAFREFVMQLCVEEATRYAQVLIPMKAGGPVYKVICGLALLAETFERGMKWHQRSLVSLNDPALGVMVALPQGTLAALCGVSRSILSPVLKPLKQKGWVDVAYGRTLICHPESWARLAETIRQSASIHAEMTADWAPAELARMGLASQTAVVRTVHATI
jgi:CRP/FNR family cyclic AMP-dependent transcriptional regulator